MRARASDADLALDNPLPLITNFWRATVPILVDLHPDRNMVMDVALTGWRFDGTCGPLRPGIQVDFEVSMKVDIAGQLVDLFTYKYLSHSMNPEATFDPAHPWSFTFGQTNLSGFLDKTYVGDFPPENLFVVTRFFLRDAKARP